MRYESGTMVFDHEIDGCFVRESRINGRVVTFVQCLDFGHDNAWADDPIVKRYCSIDADNDILHVMMYGDKWPRLPGLFDAHDQPLSVAKAESDRAALAMSA